MSLTTLRKNAIVRKAITFFEFFVVYEMKSSLRFVQHSSSPRSTARGIFKYLNETFPITSKTAAS